MFVYRLSPFPFSLLAIFSPSPQTGSLFTSSAMLGTKRYVPDKIQVVTFVSKIKGAMSPGELAKKTKCFISQNANNCIC